MQLNTKLAAILQLLGCILKLLFIMWYKIIYCKVSLKYFKTEQEYQDYSESQNNTGHPDS